MLVSPRSIRPLLLLLTALLLALALPARAQTPLSLTLVPIGSGYTAETLQRFARAAVERDGSNTVDLLVLPITFASDAYTITKRERKENLDLADTRRGQLETACNVVKEPDQTCNVVLAPILVRSDALDPANLALFVPDLDGMYILGGDQVIAMQVVVNTPVEQKMADAYHAGAVVGGNSAGAAVESVNMIAGYVGDNGPENGLEQGSVDLWLNQGVGDETRGLSFGLPNALLDQHVLQRGRIGRLINAAFTTGLLGVGVDAETGATIVNEAVLTDVSGRSAAIVVDPTNAAGGFGGPTNSLSVRGIVTHVLPTGGYGYDLATRQPTVSGAPVAQPATDRDFAALRTPQGAGPLLLGGDLSASLGGAAMQRLVVASGANPDLVVFATGYAKRADARAAAKERAAALSAQGANVQWFVLDTRSNASDMQNAIASADGMVLTAPDQSLVLPALAAVQPTVNAIRARWLSGAALLADNAAAAALGTSLATDPPPPSTTSGLEEASIRSFRPDSVPLADGLQFVAGVAIEPRLLPDRQWGQVYNLLAADPMLLGVGIDRGTAIELSATGATVVGDRTAVVLDGRAATFGTGSNGALAALYVLLDAFIDGQAVTP